jgi:DNA-binding NarL/FixJ family response regulator
MYSDRKPVPEVNRDERDLLHPPRTRVICFVGSGDLFSEVVLRTVEAELERIRAIRMPDMATLHLVMQDRDEAGMLANLCALVADERNATAMLNLADREPERFGDLTQVIAFENEAFACELLANRRARLVSRQISLLPMNLKLATWVSLLRLIGSGGHYVPPRLFGLATSAPTPELETKAARSGVKNPAAGGGALIDALTPRETEVLKMAAGGAPNKAIAHALDLSEHTVKLHMHRVIAKLGVTNRTEAAVWFFQHNENA